MFYVWAYSHWKRWADMWIGIIACIFGAILLIDKYIEVIKIKLKNSINMEHFRLSCKKIYDAENFNEKDKEKLNVLNNVLGVEWTKEEFEKLDEMDK